MHNVTFLFSSSDFRMVSIIDSCVPAVCVDAHILHVMVACVFVVEIWTVSSV